MTKALRIGGFISGAILIAFGVVVIVLAINAHSTVTDSLKDEKIVGSADMNPSDIEAAMKEAGLSGVDVPSCDVADEEIDTGSEARCFAEYMRIHALEASGGLTYAEMGRFATENGDAKGTNDAEQAAKDDKGQPVSNSARNLWVTETALSTALNVSYMAEQLSLFSLVVGIALLLAGVGFIVLAYAAMRPPPPKRPPHPPPHRALAAPSEPGFPRSDPVRAGSFLSGRYRLPWQQVVRTAHEYSRERLFGSVPLTMMAIAALLATASSVNATLYASGGLTKMLADVGQFPPILGRRSRLGPHGGMLVTAGIVLVTSNLVDLSAIASVGSACSLVIFCSWVVLRTRHVRKPVRPSLSCSPRSLSPRPCSRSSQSTRSATLPRRSSRSSESQGSPSSSTSSGNINAAPFLLRPGLLDHTP